MNIGTKDSLHNLLYEYIKNGDRKDAMYEGNFSKINNELSKINNEIKTMSTVMNRPYNSEENSEYNEYDSIQHKSFIEYIKTGNINQMMIQTKDMSGTGTGPQGGFMVSQILNREIISIAEEENIFRKIARVKTVKGDRNEYLQVVDKIGDLGWTAETASRKGNTKTPTLKKITIKLFEMYAQPRVTQNLLVNDSYFDIYGWLRDEIADAFSITELNGFLTGNGTDQPLGMLSSSDITGIERVKTASPKKIQFDDILSLYNSLDPRYRNGACFVMSPRAQSAIYSLKDSNGQFISQHSFIDKIPDRLFGLPVYICNSMDDGDDTGHMPIIFGNFKVGYLILDCAINNFIRDDISDKPWVSFYTTKRVGASVIDGNALKILEIS